jgi:hypothetical protein
LVLVGGLDLRLMKMRLYRSWEVSLVERPHKLGLQRLNPLTPRQVLGSIWRHMVTGAEPLMALLTDAVEKGLEKAREP